MLQILIACIAVAAVFLAIRSIRSPGSALALMWSMYAFEQLLQQESSFFLQRGSFLNIALTLIAAGVLTLTFLRGEFSNYRTTLSQYYIYGILCWAAISFLWTISPNDTKEQLQLYLPFLVAFVGICPLLAHHPTALQDAIRATIYFGGLILLGISFSNVGARGIVLGNVAGDTLEGNPLAVASYAGTVGICSVFSLYTDHKRFWLVILRMTIVLLAAWVIIRTGSRGQLIALVAACFVWLPITAKVAARRSTILPLVAICALCFGVVYAIGESSVAYRWKWDSIISARMGRLSMAVGLFEHYIRGGLGAWLFGLGSSASFKAVGFYPHVVPIEVLCELGVLGAMLFFLFFKRTIEDGWGALRTKRLRQSDRVLIGTVFALFSFHSILLLKQGSLLNSPEFMMTGMTLAVAVAAAMRRSKMPARQHQPVSVPENAVAINRLGRATP